jgi:hypothetical protein
MTTAKLVDFLASSMTDSNGDPLSGYQVRSYASDGSTAKAVWADRAKTLPDTGGKTEFDLSTSGTISVYGDGVYVFKLWTPTADPDVDNPYLTIGPTDVTNGKDLTIVETVSDLRLFSATPEANDTVSLLGYNSAGDGGGGDLYWDATSTETDNSITIFKITAVATGRWKRVNSLDVSPEMGGAQNGVECGVEFQRAIDAAETTFGGEVQLTGGFHYLIERNIFYGNAKVNGNGARITIDVSDGFIETASPASLAAFNPKTYDTNYTLSSITKAHWDSIEFEIVNTTEFNVGTGQAYPWVVRDLDGIKFTNTRWYTTDTGAVNRIGSFIDVHSATTGFVFDNGYMDNRGTGTAGGCIWVRGFAEGTKLVDGVKITNSEFHNAGGDEALTISSRGVSTMQNALISGCEIYDTYAGGSKNVIAVLSQDAGSILKDVLVTDCKAFVSGVTSNGFKVLEFGTNENVRIKASTYRCSVNNSGAVAMQLITGWDSAEDCHIIIDGITALSANARGFVSCGEVINCSLSVAAGVEAAIATAGYDLLAVSSGNGRVLGGNFTGIISSMDELINANISIAGVYGSPPLQNIRNITSNTIATADDPVQQIININTSFTNGSVHIKDNTIIDSSSTDSDAIIDIGASGDNEYHITGNSYYGAKTKWGFMDDAFRGQVHAFSNNVQFSAASVFRSHSNRCSLATNPWTVFAAGAELMPLGHQVLASDPASGSSQGWVKETEPGNISGDWLVMPNLP